CGRRRWSPPAPRTPRERAASRPASPPGRGASGRLHEAQDLALDAGDHARGHRQDEVAGPAFDERPPSREEDHGELQVAQDLPEEDRPGVDGVAAGGLVHLEEALAFDQAAGELRALAPTPAAEP